MNAPLIMRMGGEEYAKIGTERSTGTKVVVRVGLRAAAGQLRDRARRPVARDHLRPRRRAGRGPLDQVLVPRRLERAGAAGTDEYLDLPYDFDSMAKAGSMLGSGAIIVVDDTVPVVDVALKTAKFYRHESCGKCTPCREGTNWTVKMLERIDIGRGDPDGPRHHGLGPRPDHRQLPVRAGRRDGDADRLDDQALPGGVRGPHRGARASAADGLDVPGEPARCSTRRAGWSDAAPRRQLVTFTIDGREVQRAGELDARGRRQARRRRDPGLLLRAEARPAGRRLPHVPGRDRGHPEAPDRLLDAGQGRHGRPHADRPRARRRSARSSSSCSSTTRSTAPSATRAASARCRTSPTAGARARRASSSPSATSASRSSCRR